jgi:hypothetical protein
LPSRRRRRRHPFPRAELGWREIDRWS